MKLAERDLVPLSLRGRAGEGETGIESFIIMGGTFAMPVRMTEINAAVRDMII